MQLALSVLSRTGARKVNEDACGWWTGPGVCVCVISDGAGGHGGGDVASKLVVSTVLGWFHEHSDCGAEAIERALAASNEAVVAAQEQDPRYSDMRATAVVLAIDTERGLAAWGNLGDTRLYGFRDGRIAVRTRDHSMVQRLVDAGYLKPEDARTSPLRSRLFAALGDREEFIPYVEREPFAIETGDAFLLCTDGCWEHLEDSALAATLTAAASPDYWLAAIEERVLALRVPTQDNYSALAMWCGARSV